MTEQGKRNTTFTLVGVVIAAAVGTALVNLTQQNEVNVNVNIPANVQEFDDTKVTPPEQRFGLASDYKAVGQPFQAEFKKPFSVSGEVNRKANARLWAATLKVWGKHHPNRPQETGDCVSFGQSNAQRATLDFAISQGRAVKGDNPFPPYTYAISRVTIGRNSPRCNSAGAYPTYAIQGFQKYGWVTAEEARQAYSGRLADSWGCNGPPEALLRIGEQRAGDAYPIRTTDELIEAITNGYGCTIASDFGTRTIRERDGKMVAEWNASWPHQMAFVAYDGSGSVAYVYVLNSWGANAHPAPLSDEPPGGFWVTLATAEKMIRTGECWAISDVPGFPASDLDWSVFDEVLKQAATPRKQDATGKPLALAL